MKKPTLLSVALLVMSATLAYSQAPGKARRTPAQDGAGRMLAGSRGHGPPGGLRRSARTPRTGEVTMRNILIAGILLVLAGCENVVGPFRSKEPIRVDDPGYTIAEQQRWGRDRLALPDESRWTVPPTGLPRPGNWGTPLH